MGLDGFSMSNLGMYNRLTSAQMSNEAETIASRGSDNEVKGIDALGRRDGITRKDIDYRETGGQAFLGGNTEAAEKAEDEKELALPDIEFDDEDPENSPNRFEIRLDEATNTVELYDTYFEMSVQKITTKELLSMIRTFNDPSGVLINKKV